jgi:tRNA pseudouridine13 synthase
MAMKARGERRALRVPLADAQVSSAQDDGERRLVLGFSLPAGSFATAVLREVMKCHGDTGE